MIEVGATGEVSHRVGEADTARALGSGDVLALATPRVIAWLEEATCRAVEGFLDPGQTTVGTAIDIVHLRPSPVGATIDCRAMVASVDGVKVRLAVQAEQDGRVVARGEVTRAAVDRSEFHARLAN